MTKSKGKAEVVSRAPAPPVSRSSRVIVKDERKFQNISLNRSTGRWQAWTNCMATKDDTRGPYVGQHSTQVLAARAQDRSLLKHRRLATKQPIWLNFPESDYASDEKLRNALSNEEFIDLLKGEARACYSKVERTKCLQMFLDQEQARRNLPEVSEGKAKATTSEKVTSLRDFLKQTLLERLAKATPLAPNSKKHNMGKLWREHEADITKKIDDLLGDDTDMTDEVQDHQTQQPHEEELDYLNASIDMLATLALTHPDLKPYEH